jgi:hypothetical protein
MFFLGHAILDTAFYFKKPCYEVFSMAVYQENPVSYKQNYADLKKFSQAACQTSNPDIIWSIAKVESNFNFKIVGIEGKNILKTDSDINEYLKKAKKDSNFDLGPMQINWKYHASKSGYPARYFFDGSFSVYYVTQNILGGIVKSCKQNWVSCYHSFNSQEGNRYKTRIFNADQKLRIDLKKMITSS